MVTEQPSFVPHPLFLRLIKKLGSLLPALWQKDWVREWSGWKEATAALHACRENPDLLQEICSDAEHRFLALVQQNVSLVISSDHEKQRQLKDAGFIFGIGEVHDNNDCLADSLLQLLLIHNVVDGAQFNGIHSRRTACHDCRRHLVYHQDSTLHPRVRRPDGSVASVSPNLHANAYLQHNVHGPAIILFFLNKYGYTSIGATVSHLSIVAHARYDSEQIPSEATTLSLPDRTSRNCLTLDVYCQTNDNMAGNHYDPMWRSQDSRVLAEPEHCTESLPAELYQSIVKHLGDQHRHLLDSNWVKAWSGWKDGTAALNAARPNENVMSNICKDVQVRFLQWFDERMPGHFCDDTERKSQLYNQGFDVGIGMDHDCDLSLTDSLLQLLLMNSIVKHTRSTGADPSWRKSVSHQCQKHVDQNSSPLRNVQCSLKHERQGTAILDFLLKRFSSNPSRFQRTGIQIQVFSRYDADKVTPISVFHMPASTTSSQNTAAPTYVFHLYCNQIEDTMNHRYDPIWDPKMLGPRPNLKRSQAQSRQPKKKPRAPETTALEGSAHDSPSVSAPNWFTNCEQDLQIVFGGVDRAFQIAQVCGLDLGRGAVVDDTAVGFLTRLQELPWISKRRDDIRQNSLRKKGFIFGQSGRKSGQNPLIDSLIQSLSFHGLVDQLRVQAPASRQRLADAAREQLQLTPPTEAEKRLKQLLGVSTRCYHHSLHAPTLLMFLLRSEEIKPDIGPIRAIRVNVHSRLDESDKAGIVQVVDLCDLCTETENARELDIHLYNATGNALLSCIYDPMFLTGNVKPRAEKSTAATPKIVSSKPTFSAPPITNQSSDTVTHAAHTLNRLLAEKSLLLRDHPTLPPDKYDLDSFESCALNESAAVILPDWHCAFRGCAWQGHSESELRTHLQKDHSETLADAMALLPRHFSEDDKIWSIYNECIATKAAHLQFCA